MFDICLLQERSRIILRFADLVEKHSNELAALESWNSGKLYEQCAKSELPTFVRLFHYYAGSFPKIVCNVNWFCYCIH